MPLLTATQAQSEACIYVAPVQLKKRRLWRPLHAFHQQRPIQSAGGRQLQKSWLLQPPASECREFVLGEHCELTVASSRLEALDNYPFPVRAGRER